MVVVAVMVLGVVSVARPSATPIRRTPVRAHSPRVKA
jgi:hypothetical protein